MPAPAQTFYIGGHHRMEGLDASGQAEAPEAGVHSLPRLFHARRDMALLSFKESTAGAYGLKASNAALSISTSIGTSPIRV
jgi:hypothetical protein